MTTVSAVVRRGDAVLLVRQQGRGDEREWWCLPGGVVEPGESIADALAREVREETGLATNGAGSLAWVCAVTWTTTDAHKESFAFVFEVADPGGSPTCDDPDTIVREAAFIPIDQATELLGCLPWPRMRDPAIAYLQGRAPQGAMYEYELRGDGAEDVLRSVIASPSG